MESVVKVLLEGVLPSYNTDDFEICASKAQNRDERLRLSSVTQQMELLVLFGGNQNPISPQKKDLRRDPFTILYLSF